MKKIISLLLILLIDVSITSSSYAGYEGTDKIIDSIKDNLGYTDIYVSHPSLMEALYAVDWAGTIGSVLSKVFGASSCFAFGVLTGMKIGRDVLAHKDHGHGIIIRIMWDWLDGTPCLQKISPQTDT